VFRYLVGSAVLRSDEPLETLSPAGHPGDVEWRLSRLEALELPSAPPLVAIAARGTTRPSIVVHRAGAAHLLELAGIGRFRIACGEIAFALGPDTSWAALEQAIVDQVVPRALHLHGRPCLHASAAWVAGVGAIALLGESGAGKSTLCAQLATQGRIVSDDSLSLRVTDEAILALPGYPSLRLWRDAVESLGDDARGLERATPRSPKLRAPRELVAEPVPLALIAILSRTASADERAEQRLGGRAAFEALQPHVHRLDPEAPKALAAEFSLLAALAARVPIVALRYAPDIDTSDGVAARLLSAASRG
jgi:hypothetical protein